jgi:hypothetical protein
MVTVTLLPVPPVAGHNTLVAPTRLTGNPGGDALTTLRWLQEFYELWSQTVQVEGTLGNYGVRITNLESEIGAGGVPITSFNSRPGPAITLLSADVIAALGFTPGPAYTLPAATTLVRGGVRPDGSSITIAGDVISAPGGSSYTLPIAQPSTLGGIKPDNTSITVDPSTGVASAATTGRKFVTSGMPTPLLSGLTWANQGGAAAVNKSNGGPLVLTVPTSSGDQLRMLLYAVPGSTPWVATVQFSITQSLANWHDFGLALYDGTKVIAFFFDGRGNQANFLVSQWSSVSAFAVQPYPTGGAVDMRALTGPTIFMQIVNSGTTRTYSLSSTGDPADFVAIYSEASGTYLTETYVGVVSDNPGSAGAIKVNIFALEVVTGSTNTGNW